MIEAFIIQKSTGEDLDIIFGLYREAVSYQEKNGYSRWPEFERALIEGEVRDGRHYKILDGDAVACVFSVVYNDPIIWKEKDEQPSVYLHRIATNPDYKGRGMMNLIKDWAHENARQLGRKYIRMDTWRDNEQLKNYYINCGFKYLTQIDIPANHELPSHYWGISLSLFEIEV